MLNDKPVILIVEDEPGIAELLRYALEAAGFSVVIAVTADAARQAVARDQLPQAVLLDWMLPDHPGILLLQEWRGQERTAGLPILMLTAKGLDDDKVAGLNAGADDYVTKPFSPRELVSRIKAVLRRQSSAAVLPELKAGAITLDAKSHLVQVDGSKVDIGPAEFRLLCFLMEYPERIFSRNQLLNQVWGDHTVLEERTVDVHIMRLRRRLGPSAACIKTMRGVGYMLKVDSAE